MTINNASGVLELVKYAFHEIAGEMYFLYLFGCLCFYSMKVLLSFCMTKFWYRLCYGLTSFRLTWTLLKHNSLLGPQE